MLTVLLSILVLVAFAGTSWFFYRQAAGQAGRALEEAVAKAALLREEAKRRSEEVQLKVRNEVAQVRLDSRRQLEEQAREQEEEMNEQELALEREAARVESATEELKVRDADLANRFSTLSKRNNMITELKNQKRELQTQIPSALETAAKLSSQEMRDQIYRQMVESAETQAQENLRLWEQIPESDFIPKAKRIMGIAMGRLSRTEVQERPANSVTLSTSQYQHILKLCGGTIEKLSELFKIPVFAQVAEDAVIRFDTIDAVNREIARRVLEKTIENSRQITTWENLADLWQKKSAEMENEITGYGRKAFKLAGLKPKAHKEIIQLLGRLFFRTSYTQNQWLHTIEAAQLAGLIAAEMHLDVELARRAALLHDIGKALTHEVEGSHAVIGCELAAQYGEEPVVVNAIGAHHGEVGNESIYASLVMAADAMSGGRPGARREQLETYFDRINDLERAARAFPGIQEVFAVQAGRELRVQVDSQRMDDERTMALAADISRKISQEVTFPGQVKVTVIRTFTAQEVAR